MPVGTVWLLATAAALYAAAWSAFRRLEL